MCFKEWLDKESLEENDTTGRDIWLAATLVERNRCANIYLCENMRSENGR